MRAEDLREQIAKRLFFTHATDFAAVTAPEIYKLCQDAADALMPLIARAQADALTDAADWLDGMAVGTDTSKYTQAGRDIIARIRWRAETYTERTDQ